MATYMADTHSLLWAFTKPRKLGNHARQAFEEIADGRSKLLIPVIVLAELIFTVENKPVQADMNEILARIEDSLNIEFVDFDLPSALALRELTAIPEMHDRMIVASAIKHQAALITLDETITKSGLVEAVW